MASVNKAIIIGRLGKDPEVRYTPSGSAVCTLNLATDRKWKNKAGEMQEETEWHSVVLYERQAEVAGEYLKKGRPVYIEGRLKTRKWQDKQGNDRYTTEIVCESMKLLGGDRQDNEPTRTTSSDPAARPAPRPAPRQPQQTGTGFDDMGDDIPF